MIDILVCHYRKTRLILLHRIYNYNKRGPTIELIPSQLLWKEDLPWSHHPKFEIY